ncbi:CelD/BcsL family acetyltransferase involved in cellulose biosynthesis [Litorimonas taeanensis]|uniref:CelD/BcsL family acetyltransferase involved in cellulose biosynthesis n=1 Tax=Litorimonas taeanensis TaxID=568099 RepID=A0A420WDL1_9PROT|nr:GNAT family N-acetyltransferase [Litorimonas taeanensis]RKQ69000.1 CelD/BcsL family acetyltransferase involved in cellulose biosynthesis [Litorimonas taeanensis]
MAKPLENIWDKTVGGNTLQTYVYKSQDLPDAVRAAWSRLRASNPKLYSPYFHIDYTLAVASLRKDVNIAVLEEAGEIVAILPYQGESFARPVGAPMTDYHGLICGPDYRYSLQDILSATSVGAYHFSALVSDIEQDVPKTHLGAVMSFPEGAEVWREARDSSFRKHQKSLRRRIRKATEEIGAPHIIFRSQSIEEFDTLIDWKVAQYAASGYYNVLGAEWTLPLLKSLWKKGIDAPLRLEMHSLYFGNQLAAIDTGLTDGTTYHSWIVAYNNAFRSYSPGTQLLNQIIDASDTLGYKTIDLGLGIDDFKQYYASETVKAASGFASISGPAAKLSKLYDAAEKLGQKHLSDAPGRLRRRYNQVSACEDTLSGRAKAMFSAVTAKKS